MEGSLQYWSPLVHTVTVASSPPSRIRAVLRTSSVWVDRARVRVAFSVSDDSGNVVVSSDYTVRLLLGSSDVGECTARGASSSYVGYCSLSGASALEHFDFSNAATVSVTAALKVGGSTIMTSFAGSLKVVAKPSWYSSALLHAASVDFCSDGLVRWGRSLHDASCIACVSRRGIPNSRVR